MTTKPDLTVIGDYAEPLKFVQTMADNAITCDYGSCRHTATAIVMSRGEMRPLCFTHVLNQVTSLRTNGMDAIIINQSNYFGA
jgi:hypothetical protein